MNKQEYQWHLEKVGHFSASRAADLVIKSASGLREILTTCMNCNTRD